MLSMNGSMQVEIDHPEADSLNNYWRRIQNYDFRAISENCICGHRIDENCYILNKQTKEILVSGNCCIEKFLPER